MAVSLKKSVKVDLSKPELPQKMREYTPIHLMDEEESIQKRVRQTMSLPCDNPKIQIKSESGGISSAARIKHVSSHLAEKSTHKSDGQAEPPTDENDDFTEAQESTPKRTVEKIIDKLYDIWFEITHFFDFEGFGPLICVTVLFVISLLSMAILNDLMSDITFELSAVETSAEIISVGEITENRKSRGMVVRFTDAYGCEQEAKALVDIDLDVKVGDFISIRYDPDNAEKVSVEKPIIGIVDLKNLQ